VAAGIRFHGVVLHDAEDVCHKHELTVYDHLLGRRLAMVQLPVVPLVDHGSRWVSGHYLDEFAELHTKDIVVREALGAAVPSAGVACAIDRTMLGRIADLADGEPFDASCLTEDYELGLKIKLLGGRGALVRIRSRTDGQVVATREHFPATFDTALRQKTRWLHGIALSGWDRIGWQGGIADRYMLMRDRKAILASLLTLMGYVAVALVLVNLAVAALLPVALRMPSLVSRGSLLAGLLWFNAAMLAWRLAMRSLFSTRAYGWREGIRAVPRAIVGNAINAVAAMRACKRYWRIARGREQNSWDKTAHRFPVATP
jgi:adsorption protein B